MCRRIRAHCCRPALGPRSRATQETAARRALPVRSWPRRVVSFAPSRIEVLLRTHLAIEHQSNLFPLQLPPNPPVWIIRLVDELRWPPETGQIVKLARVDR